jgi:hypothetical protein
VQLTLLIGLSMATLERAPNPMRIAGVVISLAGTVWYSAFKLQELPKPAPAKTADEKAAPLVSGKGKPTESAPLINK